MSTHDRMGWTKRKPHCRDRGYVASLKAAAGGWLVIYDRAELGEAFDPRERWAITHFPSGRRWVASSQPRARAALKALAAAAALEHLELSA